MELCKWQKILLQDTRNKLPVTDFSYHPPKICYGQGVIPGLSCDPPHIYKPLSFIQRKLTAKLRLGMLHLRVETGRFSRPRLEPEERICLTCNNGQVEDESHFLLHCVTYQEYRQRLFGFIPNIADFNLLPDTDKLKFLLNDQSIIKQSSRFIVDSYEHRSTII